MSRGFTNAPELLLNRSDSRDPATTCRGITSSGRPCRRASVLTKAPSPTSGGVVANFEDDEVISDSGFYCWQHKDQAEQNTQRGNQGRSRHSTQDHTVQNFLLQQRNSIETFVQRLGIDTVSDDGYTAKPKVSLNSDRRRAEPSKPKDRTSKQSRGQATFAEKGEPAPPSRRKSTTKRKGFWASLCCTGTDEEDYVEIVRHKKRVQRTSMPPEVDVSRQSRPAPTHKTTSTRPSTALLPTTNPAVNLPIRPFMQSKETSFPTQTGPLLSFVPKHLSPQITSALLIELAKPISPSDEEGYIYVFWLTPQNMAAPAQSTAHSLLSSPATTTPHTRRISDVMTEYSFDGSEPETKGRKTIMLKIGRANNVTRRMNEWQRQCGFQLTLIRWYPYLSSSSMQSSQPLPIAGLMPQAQHRESGSVQKVPYAKRVERLIHLELAEKQVKKRCEACGRQHREWFEVEASQTGVKGVDECIKRWVGWAQRE